MTVSGPTRTWPCSTNVTASRSVSAIFSRTITTARRRRQKELVDRRSSWVRLFLVSITPRSWSLFSRPSVRSMRVVSLGSNRLSVAVSLVTMPQSLLYFL